MKILKKICKNPDCQVEFETTHHAKLYCCPKCQQDTSKKNYIANKKEEEKVAEIKRKSLVNIAIKAKQLGLSYGQYVQKYGV